MEVEFAYVPWLTMVGRLLMAAAAGAIVGLERERRDHPAGLRTLLLVSAGSCLFTLVSIVLGGEDFDPGRVAAGIITGIGFLGAGTILRHGGTVQGLTTAASIWAVSAVGMAAALGWWQAVIAGTVLMFLSLTLLKWLERRFFHPRRPLVLRIEAETARLSLARLRDELAASGRETVTLEVTCGDETGACVVSMELDDLPQPRAEQLVERVARVDGVRSARVG